MLLKVLRILAVAVLTVVMFGGAPVQAQEMPPIDLRVLSPDWVEIAPGESHVYRFDYKADGDDQAHMEVKFYTVPAASARLTVRNSDQIRLWATQGKNEWFGAALPQDLAFKQDCNAYNKPGKGDGYDKECHDDKGDRIWFTSEYAHWEATLGASGRYWIVVQPNAGVKAPVVYKVVVSGPGFSFWGGNP
jgi:hypothetical protein